MSQNDCGTLSRQCAGEEASAFVRRKPQAIKEAIVQIRKSRMPYFLTWEVPTGGKLALTDHRLKREIV